jgi:5'-methylthioadenosine nucleosidase
MEDDNKTINTAVILIAMAAEAQPLISNLGLKLDEKALPESSPAQCYSGERKGLKVHVVTNGQCKRFQVDEVGTVAAGLTTWLANEYLKPDILINAGTCGGFRRKGAEIGDVFISSDVANHDRRIALPGGWKDWAIGKHTTHVTEELRRALSFKHGNVSTSNSLDATETDRQLMLENDASLKDMEAAAVAWACDLHCTPMFCVKVVTDIVDGDRATEEEFLENLSTAAKSLQSAVPGVLDFIYGRKLKDL